jgi:hypothetical protein
MDDKEFCKEVRKVLEEIGPEGKTILKKILWEQDRLLNHSIWRYKTKKHEEAYERILKFRKLKNLLEHLISLGDNDDKEREE